MIGAQDFFGEGHLRGNHGKGVSAVNCRAGDQPLQLNLAGAGNDDDPIASGFAFGFIEKWDIGQKNLAGLAACLRLSGPLAADARMQDLLERALFSLVGENYGPKCAAIQDATGRKNFLPKMLAQKCPHFRILIHQFASGPVGIEKLGSEQFVEVATERGFASRNATGDPDDDAGFGHRLARF